MKKYPHGLTLTAICAAIEDYQRHEESVPEEGILAAFNTLLGHSDIAEAFRTLEQQRDALAAENAYLLPKAASELSNAWVLHKFWVGIHAALMHMKVGRIYDAEQWLQNTIAGPGIEAPNLKLTEEIEAWANEQNKDSISHLRALEIIKAETPATDAYLNSVRAEAISNALDTCTDHCDTDCVMDAYDCSYEIAQMRSAGAIDLHDGLVAYATQLRAGKGGE